MTGQAPDTIEPVFKISDPGEVNRDQHLWGDRLMINLGNLMAWLFPILMTAIVAQVFMRKAGFNQAWLDDAQWWIYGVALLTGFGYAITTDSHVRVDIFHEKYPEAKKARIEVFALGWLFLPFLAMMFDILIHYAAASWVAGEGSDSPNGLHGLYWLKATLPLLFGAAIIAAFAALYRNLSKLTAPILWHVIIGAFPALWFAVERGVYYILWWVVRLSDPDLNPRRISREPLMDNTMWYGLALLLGVAVVSFWRQRRRSVKV